jgi:hypothetical protein
MIEMRFFTASLAACFVALLILAVAISIVIDPYGMFASPRIGLVNHDKTQAILQPYRSKVYLAEIAHPKTVLLGDSRVDVGLNPTSSGWRSDLKPVFNLAIPGNPLSEHLRYFQYALTVLHPKLVIVGVAFDDCFVWPVAAGRKDQGSAADQNARLIGGVDNRNLLAARMKDYFSALLSLDALEDSFMTIFNQNNPRRAHMTALGWHSPGDFRTAVDAEGYYNVIMAKDRSRVGTFLEWAKAPQYDLAPLSKLLAAAASHNVKVIVLLPPAYIDDFEILKQIHVLDIYDDWKADLVRVVHGAQTSGTDVSLWDFNQINDYSAEDLPGRDDRRSKMRWFWETDHFKAELGDRIIASLMGGTGSELGMQLTAENVGRQIAEMHDRLLEFERSHTRDVSRIAALVAAGQSAICARKGASCPPPQRPYPNLQASTQNVP